MDGMRGGEGCPGSIIDLFRSVVCCAFTRLYSIRVLGAVDNLDCSMTRLLMASLG